MKCVGYFTVLRTCHLMCSVEMCSAFVVGSNKLARWQVPKVAESMNLTSRHLVSTG